MSYLRRRSYPLVAALICMFLLAPACAKRTVPARVPEPGRYLEIIAQANIVVVTDYGSARYEFALPEPIADHEARTTQYVATSAGHMLTRLLEGSPCSDTMSGEQFETTVTVTLDDRQFTGCGRPLH